MRNGTSHMKRKKTDYGIVSFFAMCRKFGVSWPKASEEQKAFIEEITRINYEREMAKRNMTAKPVRGFFDAEVSA